MDRQLDSFNEMSGENRRGAALKGTSKDGGETKERSGREEEDVSKGWGPQ